ncbi:breast carcinoma-amplified sequence 1 isoform X5 [Microcaecilia unicolor]|uniref:Breast carcinoma-amplified sequence 1 isoform X5 n=1 Tax=Microcaecilia unicolor TaxID=1415580 RepID=A0A6P7Z0J1_9AMPH|nr:breast carcinoma-amplified sequence 1 isoform X5 [Microcaecilia unicolor]
MGNEISVHEDSENQENEFSAEDAKHASVNGNLQNGSITIHHVETVSLQRNDVVDTNANIKQNNVDPSSQKTMEIMSVSEENEKSPGNEAKPATPATKSFFRIMLSRPAPGRTKEPTGDSAAGTEKSDGNSAKLLVNNAPSESLKSPETAVLNESSDKGPNQALNSTALNVGQPNVTEPEPPQPEDTASKPKEISLFDKLFKPERARENTKAQPNLSQEINTAPKQDPNLTVQDVSGLQQNSVLPEQNIDVDSQSVVQLQSSATFSSPSEEDLKESRAKEENSKAAASPENNPVMSFFKTLVTPKSLPKPEDEPKSDSEDKSAKENQQTTETKRVEEPAVVAIPVKAEKTAPVQIVKQETKTPERAAKEQVPAPSEVQTDGPQKPSKESAPRAKLFWKKQPAKEVPPPSAPKENTVAEPEVQIVVQQPPVQAAAPSKDVIKTSEGQKAKKSSFMMFFKQLSVSDDGGSTGAEEVNSKDPDHPTLDSTEGSATQKISQKSVAPVIIESQPAGPKGKESAKEKKVTAELHKQKTNKQETKDSQEIASSAQQPLSQPQAIQNGGDPAKDPTLKRTEKRQSFGSFFKGIAPKKTCDAEVQTDPAPILK